jgi:Ca2+-binding RTX toxin-like protein
VREADTGSFDFPTTPGGFDATLDGIIDVFVTKLMPDGSDLLDSTFGGGSDDENGGGIAVDESGSVYVTGHTDSSDFTTTLGAFDTIGANDVFVVKFAPPEVCDGLDNNLDDLVDEGFPDTDADGIADCVDTSPLGVCGGVAVTMLGTAANDSLTGTSGVDVIDGGDGNDTLDGKGGNDQICGSAGNDILRGAGGNDTLDGGTGTDRCSGGTGTDTGINCETVSGVP